VSAAKSKARSKSKARPKSKARSNSKARSKSRARSKPQAPPKPARRPRRHTPAKQRLQPAPSRTPTPPTALQPEELAALRQQLDARIAEAMPARWNPDPEEVRRAVMKLVLTIVEFVRQLLERQAVRRMEAQTLSVEQIEAVGLALMRLEEAVQDLAKRSGLEPSELNLDLGPLGRLV
jgi:hypothetical protein